MANKKNVSNKKTTSSKNKNNSKKKVQEDNIKKIESVGEFDTDYKHIVIVASIIIIIFCAFYFLTVYITGRNQETTTQNTTHDSTFSYTDTIAGRTFSMPENEYLVLYYDQSDSDLTESFSTVIYDYRGDPDHYALYGVDMSSDLNQSYVAEESNENPASISDLAISGPTLIHFKDGSVVEYIEGVDSIIGYLE